MKQVFLDSLGTSDGEGDAVHHRRRAVLLRHVVDHVGVADDVRVLARPCRARASALAAAERAQRVPYMAAIAIAVLAFLCAFPAYFSRTSGRRGYVAYAAVTSIATIGLYIAYAIPIFLRLRLGDAWEPGEWNLGKRYKRIGTIAVPLGRCSSRSCSSCRSLRPGSRGTTDFTWLSFNYAPIAVVGTLLLVGGWWLVSAHKWFKGPIAQGTPEELARIEAQYERGGRPARHRRRRRIDCDDRIGGSRRAPAPSTKEADPVLTLDELRARRVDRHRGHGVHRHAGAPARQAPASRLLLRAGRSRARHRGLQLPARARHGDGSRAGYEIASWERGYGDFELAPDLATLRRIPWLEATALVLCDVAWGDGSPVAAVAAPGAARAGRAARGHWASRRCSGRSSSSTCCARRYEEAHAKALPRPDAVGAVHPRLPHPRDDLRRAAAAADPERDARRRHPRRDLEGRGVAGPAGDQLPLRGRADDGGQPRRLQERRQGDRAPERLLDHVHGEARPHVDRHRRATSTRRCGATARARSPARATSSAQYLAGQIACARELAIFFAPNDQLVQAVRGRLVGADDARVGPRQPDVRVPGRRVRRGAARRRRGSPAATSTRISRSRR